LCSTQQDNPPKGLNEEQRRVIRVCAVADLSEGEAVRLDVEVPIAVFNVRGELFAVDDTCTHQDASLADGYLEDDCTVECPLHASCFDLRTGEPTGPPARVPLRTHHVVVQDGTIFVVPRPALAQGVVA
jgi:3-phenylpropionate/trans-cinnamate dioxygenase ferredoxin subunit